MDVYKIIYLLATIFDIVCCANPANVKAGSYRAEILMARNCNTAKEQENGDLRVTLLRHGNISTGMRFEGQVYKTSGPIGLKLTMMRMDGDRNTTVMTRVCKDVCNSIVTRAYAQQLGLLDEKCYIKPGPFMVILKDYNRVMHYIVQSSFFYATFLAKVSIRAEHEEIACFNFVVQTLREDRN